MACKCKVTLGSEGGGIVEEEEEEEEEQEDEKKEKVEQEEEKIEEAKEQDTSKRQNLLIENLYPKNFLSSVIGASMCTILGRSVCGKNVKNCGKQSFMSFLH